MIRHAILGLALFAGTSSVVHAQGIREVAYGPKSVVSVAAKLRFTTLIILPEGEEILDFVCGDKDFWVISGAQNFAYVKPAKAGAATNLNLVTASGRVYSFLLAEGSADPDLKMYVRLESSTQGAAAMPRLHSAAEVQSLRATIDETKREVQDAREAAARAVEDAASAKVEAERATDEKLATFRAAYPGTLQFPYRFPAHQRPFLVSAIFHDGQFTYIRTHATELPSVYELVDGKPNLVTFQVEDGLYIVPRVLERGYLTIGKQTLRFEVRR
jgi:type IV secretion system protein VirB9